MLPSALQLPKTAFSPGGEDYYVACLPLTTDTNGPFASQGSQPAQECQPLNRFKQLRGVSTAERNEKMAKQYGVITWVMIATISMTAYGHGSAVSPKSRVYRVFQSNPENPNFQLARNAIEIDSKQAYYTWNQVSQNIPEAVNAGLPAGFDYSPWVPDGRLASGGRYDSEEFGIYTYGGLDQVSNQWPTTALSAGETITLDFWATAPHEPSVWDVWMTTPDWDPNTELNWNQMEFLGRPDPILEANHYTWDFTVPTDRSGHHVMWIAWQRDDPVGEVFFSTSDLLITAIPEPGTGLVAGAGLLLGIVRRRRVGRPVG